MQIEANKVVIVAYRLEQEGELLQETTPEDPFAFLYGIGQTLPGFDAQLEGKAVGDEVSFRLSPEQAYGEVDERLRQQVARAAFEGAPEGALAPGNILPMQLSDNESQRTETLFGKVDEVTDDFVFMDFNHPLAGRTLDYTVKILEVRDPTPEELERGTVEEPGE